ncbi:M23 family metallopeptidase [Subdoligranulum variabile]|uniref:M23 family metallopeptidase n=1 Tax=Subdoligranulum variabile TaxID=214851 RepID=UPI0026F18B51|nr:M23 family metallopeptidase [Subdoligranulum variabile]
MKENKHKEIKQKPGGRLPKEQPSRVLPRTMAWQAWLKSKERVLSVTKTNPEGSYASAQEMEEQGVRQGETLLEDGAVFALGKAGNAVRKPLAHEREPNRCPPQEGMREGHSVPPDATNPDPKTAARQEQKRRAARKQSRNFQERQRQTKNTAPGLRGVDRDQKQLRTAANTVRQEKQARQAAQRTQGMLRRARQTAREGVEIARKATTVLRSAIRHLLAALQSLAAVLIAGGWVAAFIVLLICLIALVAGSAYGIFFAAETPDENAISVQEAVELLNEEYRDQLEEIEDSTEYDRQEIESDDGSYAIAWQDVLAVFASQTAGDANGAAVAYLDEDNVDRLRTVLWDMNELDWRTETQTREMEQTNEEGEQETVTITETVLIIELTHHTPEEMRETYHFTDRQKEYLTLLSEDDTATLWGELLGGFVQGSGELMAPGMDTVFADGALQWPLPVAGTITSPQGYRTDPFTGKVSYHNGTDISAPEGTPILAAADGTVTIANATDSWGGSYGYYVKIDHGGGLTTLYAHCSNICVTVGQQVLAGQVVAYVGQTGRATGPHLHFEVQKSQ